MTTESNWGPKAKLAMYSKAISAIGFKAFLERGRARHFGNSKIRPRSSEHPLHIRAETSDMLVFDQIFVDREYRCIDELSDVRTIVDAGANVGYSSAYLLSRFPQSRVVAIEPDEANFLLMESNLAPWGDRVTLLNMALWSEPTVLNFKAETTVQGREWGRRVETSDEGTVRAIDIPYIMATYNMVEIDLLKMDIEGAEEAVFSSPNLAWLDRVKNIVIELHGDQCSETFMRAIASRGYAISRCEELTVCLSSA